jgi:hypothetical protein
VIAVMSLALLAVTAAVAWAASDDTTVDSTATVDEFAEWADASPSIGVGDWTGSVGGTTINQVEESLTALKALTLYTNVNVTLSAAGGANDGIATEPTNDDTLATSYKIAGDVGTPDSVWKAAGTGAGQFFNISNTYLVTHTPVDGQYIISLSVQLESASGRAHDAGNYTCSVTLTATW